MMLKGISIFKLPIVTMGIKMKQIMDYMVNGLLIEIEEPKDEPGQEKVLAEYVNRLQEVKEHDE